MSVKRQRRILAASIAVSLICHIMALGLFQKYSLWFSTKQKIAAVADWITMVGKQSKDEVLKEAFAVSSEESTYAREEGSTFTTAVPTVETPERKQAMPRALWPEPNVTASKTLPTFTLPNQPLQLLEHLPKGLVVTTEKGPQPLLFSPMAVGMKMSLSVANLPILEEAPKAYPFSEETKKLLKIDLMQTGRAPALVSFPDLPKLPTLEELETVSYSDSFDADLVFLPKEEGDGYIFALTLIPREGLELPKIKQHFTFLIDKSNSIQQGRLNATKDAVQLALEELGPDDTFNIIAFDNKIEKMSPNSLVFNKQSARIAGAFLERLQLGSFLSTADLTKPLFLTVPGTVPKDETHTAILFTDGEQLSRKLAQRGFLYDWTQYNEGKVALYTVGMNDTQTCVLETASSFNKGKHCFASTARGMKRKVVKLMRSIQTPVAKNISCKAISHLPQTKVELLCKASQMPNLYVDQPYVILGEAASLDDFILFVQGRLKDRWINVRKTVSFINGKKGSRSLKTEWALQRALHLYERYYHEQDGKHLAEASQLLEAHDLRLAIQ